MGRRIDIYLWTGILVGFVVATVGKGSWLGHAGWAIVGVCFALWVIYLLVTSPFPWNKN